MDEQSSDRAARTFLVPVYAYGCVTSCGGMPEAVNWLSTFPKCEPWFQACSGEGLDAADVWAEQHLLFAETLHRVEYRTAAG